MKLIKLRYISYFGTYSGKPTTANKISYAALPVIGALLKPIEAKVDDKQRTLTVKSETFFEKLEKNFDSMDVKRIFTIVCKHESFCF